VRKELDEKLTQEHPTLFGDRFADMRTTCMCWGFDVGDGWYDLLKEAADKLEPLCKAEYDKYAPLEKSWYKYIRNPMGWIARRAQPLFSPLYKAVNFLLPNVYGSPLHWYGGPPRASQVKEKYGTLRFYMTHATEEMYAITDKAERQSSKTCEECGKPGKIRGRGWLYTRCSACWKKEQKNALA
jgi:hypothetical protein